MGLLTDLVEKVKSKKGIETESLGDFRFVPLKGRFGY